MRILAKAAACVLAILVALELGARLFLRMDVLAYRDSDDPALAFELLPGARGVKNGVAVEISDQGLRDEPVPAVRAPGERRVVVVGGHETFGVAVEAKDTFVRELAAGLAPAGRSARTVNVSMYSYNLDQKVELACRMLSRLSPELVVLQLSESDGRPVKPALLRAPRLKNWIRAHSVLARWASERYYIDKPYPVTSPSIPDILAKLRRFKECVGAAGGRGLVMMLPDLSAPGPAAPSVLRQRVEAGTKELGMPWVDVDAALEAVPPAKRLAVPKQPFLSPAAHRALADELRRRLKPLLKERRARQRPSV